MTAHPSPPTALSSLPYGFGPVLLAVSHKYNANLMQSEVVSPVILEDWQMPAKLRRQSLRESTNGRSRDPCGQLTREPEKPSKNDSFSQREQVE